MSRSVLPEPYRFPSRIIALDPVDRSGTVPVFALGELVLSRGRFLPCETACRDHAMPELDNQRATASPCSFVSRR